MRRKILFAAVMTTMLASCTQDEFLSKPKLTDEQDLVLTTNQASLAGRLKTGSGNLSGTVPVSEKILPTVPPEIPSNVIPIEEASNSDRNGKTLEHGKNYIIRKGEKWRGNISVNAGAKNAQANLYVEGELEIADGIWTLADTNIKILPGAKMTLGFTNDADFEVIGKFTNIDCWGEFSLAHPEKGLKLSPSSHLKLFANYEEEFSLNGHNGHDALYVEEGVFYCERPLTVNGTSAFNNGQAILWGASTFLNKFNVKGIQTYINLFACTTVEGDLSMTEQANVNVNSYLKATNIDVQNGSIELFGGTMLEATKDLYVGKSGSVSTLHAGCYSVITVGRLVAERNGGVENVIGNFDIHTKELKFGTIGNIEGDIEQTDSRWNRKVIFNGRTVIESDGCRPEFKPEDIILEEVASISPVHGYSATSIDFNGNMAYVSWHANPQLLGKEVFGGIIDVLNISEQILMQSLENKKIKYNHTMFHNRALYTAGANFNNGAVLSEITLTADGLFPTSLTEVQVHLNGASGNCVTHIDRNFVTASGGINGGFDYFPTTSTESLRNTPAWGKYIYTDGKHIVTLANPGNGVVALYNYETEKSKDYQNLLTNPALTINTGEINPIDGKNVCICDKNHIYVCMGNHGLKRYDIESGKADGHYEIKQVNGVEVDDDYVYVANGYGITILNKSDFSYAASFNDASASANFIRKGEDGLIYVAYGQKGVKIFRIR